MDMIKQVQPTELQKYSYASPATGNLDSAIGDERKALFALTRDIVLAQISLGDDELSRRLWDEVAERQIDPRRVINLIYGCASHDDDAAMIQTDMSYENQSKNKD